MQRLGAAVIGFALAMSAPAAAQEITIHDAWRNSVQGIQGQFEPIDAVRVRFSVSPGSPDQDAVIWLQTRRLGGIGWTSNNNHFRRLPVINETMSVYSPQPADDWYFPVEWRLELFTTDPPYVGMYKAGVLTRANPNPPWLNP